MGPNRGRKGVTKKAILASCLSTTMLFGWHGAANAQEAPTEAESTDSGGIQEIVVMAQKREQNLQDVPAAVSAIGGDALEARGINETSDLMGAVPSLQISTPYGKTQPNFSLRGISVANEFSASTASPVGVYVDEVYQSFRASHGGQLYDIDRVEVLRGPQGTLYGRNTTGGAISFFTKKPGLSGDEGYFTLGYANYNTKTVEGGFDKTIIPDVLGIRVAGTVAKGGGWQYNPAQDRKVGTTDSIAGRVSLRWKPAETLDINLKMYAAKDNPWGANAYAIGQLAGGGDAVGYSRFNPLQNGGRALGKNEVSADEGGKRLSSSKGVALNIALELNDNFTLTSITGYDTGKYSTSPNDCDGSPNDLCSIRFNSSSRNFNQDLRLSYSDDNIDFVGGLYYGRDKIKTRNEPDFFGLLRPLLLAGGVPGSSSNVAVATPDSIRVLPMFAVNPALTPADPNFCAPYTGPGTNPQGFLDARSLIALLTDIQLNNSGGGGFGGAISAACRSAGAPTFEPILGKQQFDIGRPSKAIYGDLTWKATERLTVAVGLRYTMDKVKFQNGSTIIYSLDGTTPVANLIPYAFPYNANLPTMNLSEKANRLTGRANISYEFADDVMGYIQYSRGYRSGSYNGLAYQGTNQVYYIQPEKVNAYEGGLKTRFLDRRVQLNLAGFYYDYSNQQTTQVVGATTFTRSANGRVWGGEAELTVVPVDGLQFNAAFGYLNSKYKGNVVDPNDPATQFTRNVNGNPFPNAPKTTFNAGFDWDIFEKGDSKLTLRGDASYMGKYYFDAFGDYGLDPCDRPGAPGAVRPAGTAFTCGNPGYWLINSRLTYQANKNLSVSAWVKNLTNKYYYTYGLNIDVFGLDYLNRGTPRTYGVEATFKF
jgi:iron complex outermembrane receptor protein